MCYIAGWHRDLSSVMNVERYISLACKLIPSAEAKKSWLIRLMRLRFDLYGRLTLENQHKSRKGSTFYSMGDL